MLPPNDHMKYCFHFTDEDKNLERVIVTIISSTKVTLEACKYSAYCAKYFASILI
jgi:hypothetical protein